MLARMRPTDLLAPPLCVGCSGWAGRVEPFCRACRAELRWLGPEVVPVGETLEAWAPVAYAGPARAAVTALKFRGAVRTVNAMAAQVCAGAPPGWLDGAALVPAPLHPARWRRRGFNQAERLASAIARRRAGVVVCDCLARTGPRATQMGRTRAQRLSGITGTIDVVGAPPRRALVVDDVMTTGATLAACAQALRAAGAREVRALAYARTPGR